MPKFSKKSEDQLQTCDKRLQDICREVIKYYDFTVLEGYRDRITQDKAFKSGASKIEWPNGKHNSRPSKAVDLSPYPYTKDERVYIYLAGLFIATAYSLGIKIRWGADWNGKDLWKDENFLDWGHFEIVD